MADNKKYYYMRLKENFFDTNEMVVLESVQDGYLYSNILLKLYLRSLRDNGKLMFNNAIPYNPQMIATITRHQVGTVEKALKIFKEMGLIEIMDSGAIYMLDIQNYIGESTTEADRIRAYREKIEAEKRKSVHLYDISTPELELKLKKDITVSNDTVTVPAPFDYASVVESFNNTCSSLPHIRGLNDQRRKAIRKAYKQVEAAGGFPALFEKVEASDFLTGRRGDWHGCGFDWILKPANLAKIIEGNYDNRSGTASQPDYTDTSRYKNLGWEEA